MDYIEHNGVRVPIKVERGYGLTRVTAFPPGELAFSSEWCYGDTPAFQQIHKLIRINHGN
jgi:hypothetical protein